MRWFLDAIGLILVMALLGGILWYKKDVREREAMIIEACVARNRLELEIRYRAATRSGELNARGWPITIDAKWFEGHPPRNHLIEASSPWVEVAPADQAGLQHPPVRMAVDESLAGYWYNPYLGVLRARVPVMVSDQEAVDLYNRLNNSQLYSIFQSDRLADDHVTTSMATRREPAGEPDLDPTKPRPKEVIVPDIAPDSAALPTGMKRKRH